MAQWLAAQAKQENMNPVSETSNNSAIARKEKKRQEAELRKRLQPLRKKISDTETAMDKLHSRKKELESCLADPEIYFEENKQKLKLLLSEKTDIDKQHADLEMDWLEANEQLEMFQHSMSGAESK